MKGKVVIKDNSATWLRVQLINLDNATRAMADATVKTSKIYAPLLDGGLRNSSRIERKAPLNYSAVYGGGDIKYAAYQERGMRADGSHVVRHYTTPGTGAHFLRNAGETVSKQGIKAFL